MKKIRNNVFETNSSSTHSLTIGRTVDKNDYEPFGKNLKIRWINTDDETVLVTLTDKVSYLVSHIASWYKYNAEDYDDLLKQVQDNWDFKRLRDYVYDRYGKEIVFPKYTGDIEDIVEINHQLVSYEHDLQEVMEDMITYDLNLFDEVLQNGKDIVFGRD